jgi:restriction endonuclease S subunit
VSWEVKRLADICDIRIGKTPSRNEKSYWDVEKVGSNIWVSIADLTKSNARFIRNSKEYISDKGAALFKPVKAGTLLMSFKLSIGKLAYADCDLYTNEAIAALPIKDRNQILPDFLYYYLQFYDWDKETENDVKLKGKTLNKAKLKEIRVPVPSFAIQQKIVAKLDAIFAELDKATAAAEANAKNAEALFQSCLSNSLMNSSDCRSYKLNEICEIARGGSPRPIDKFITESTDGVNWVKIGDATRSKKYIYETKERITRDGMSRSRMVNDGDFILSNSMSFGRPYIMRTSGCIHDGWLVLSKYQKHVDIDFFFYLLSSAIVKNQFERLAQGSTVRNLNKELVGKVEVSIPPWALQKEMVKKLDAVSTEFDKASGAYGRKIVALELLKNSILQQAFSGDLVKE